MAVTTILFDYGGVLAVPLDETAVRQRRERLARQLHFASPEAMWQRFYTGPEWFATKTGRSTDAEMWETLLSPHGLTSVEARENFLQELFAGEGVDPDMRHLLVELHGRYRLAILSNASDRLEKVLADRLDILKYFELVVNSHRIGIAKPEPAAYQVALNLLQVSPEQLFFIDDLARNIEAAEALGIASHLFTNVAGLRVDLAQRKLWPLEGR